MAHLRRGVPVDPPLTFFLRCLAFASLLALSAPAAADGRAGDFDFYVLALTWTPTYCATADNPDPDQCGRPYGFLVHGLWPEYEKGYPEYCTSSYPSRVKQSVLDSVADLMPDGGVVGHEWRKHGVCSGLAPEAYFGLFRKAAAKVAVPPAFQRAAARTSLSPAAIEAAFMATNPGLSTKGMAVACGGNQLSEVRICLTTDLAFRDCPAVDADSCRAASISVPPIR